MAWVQTPLPPVSIPTAAKPVTPAAGDDIRMEDGHENAATGNGEDDGDAMAQDVSSSQAGGVGNGQDAAHENQQQHLDYDVADDNEWS